MLNDSTDRPLLVFDGDCSFCRFWVDAWKSLTEDRVAYAPFQEVADQFPEIPLENFRSSVQLVMPGGEVFAGAEAVFRTLAYAPGKKWMLWLYERAPNVAPISEACYRIVAAHRSFFWKPTRLLWGSRFVRPSYSLTRWLFLRWLGLIYLIAFLSLWPQLLGLVGHQGILPAAGFLDGVRQVFGAESYSLFPTLAWFDASDSFLRFLAAVGAVASLFVTLGIATAPGLIIAWLFYLSLVTVGGDFLSFQWDVLLLEAGFLAIFFAPWELFQPHWGGGSRRLRVEAGDTGQKSRVESREASQKSIVEGRKQEQAPEFATRAVAEQARAGQGDLAVGSAPSSTVLWLLRWLLFRLVFLSGAVKLLSRDPAWRNLTALKYHYYTQPLPTPPAWYMDQLPDWFEKLSAVFMFAVELVVPFLIFAPRRLRVGAAALIALLQVLIGVTGNYTFFNLLTLGLCLLLLDDSLLRRLVPHKLAASIAGSRSAGRSSRIRRYVTAALAAVIVLASGAEMARRLFGGAALPAPLRAAIDRLEPFHVASSYGLFAIMTTSRPEVIVQGSNDGTTWLDYEFKYKPGDLKRPPPWVEPHQPRLDWQMWFAALGSYEENRWFVNFIVRLLEGSPPVLALLAKNPFPAGPPRYVRALVYEYRFTDPATRRATGEWWRREFKGSYFPVASLKKEE